MLCRGIWLDQAIAKQLDMSLFLMVPITLEGSTLAGSVSSKP
jgi:hypothetical protein